ERPEMRDFELADQLITVISAAAKRPARYPTADPFAETDQVRGKPEMTGCPTPVQRHPRFHFVSDQQGSGVTADPLQPAEEPGLRPDRAAVEHDRLNDHCRHIPA